MNEAIFEADQLHGEPQPARPMKGDRPGDKPRTCGECVGFGKCDGSVKPDNPAPFYWIPPQPPKKLGFYQKYHVKRVDERDNSEEQYFVLRVDGRAKNREAAIKALLAYADFIEDSIPELASEIRDRYGVATLQSQATRYESLQGLNYELNELTEAHNRDMSEARKRIAVLEAELKRSNIKAASNYRAFCDEQERRSKDEAAFQEYRGRLEAENAQLRPKLARGS